VYTQFFLKFNSIEKLASASVEELHDFFSNLGLLYRSERIHEVARELVERYGGRSRVTWKSC
jgi:adenine-specific DNA glycosylase